MPTYTWHFPHPIQLMNKNQSTDQPILTPSIQLPGTYNCTASNTQGTKTKYFTVIKATSKILLLKSLYFWTSSTPSLSCCLNYSVTPSCCFPSGSHPGTTAGILMAVFFVLIFILGCVVYHKQRNSSVARPEGLNRWAERAIVTKTPISHRESHNLSSLGWRICVPGSPALHCRSYFCDTWRHIFFQQRQLSQRTAYLIWTCMRHEADLFKIRLCMALQWTCCFLMFFCGWRNISFIPLKSLRHSLFCMLSCWTWCELLMLGHCILKNA